MVRTHETLLRYVAPKVKAKFGVNVIPVSGGASFCGLFASVLLVTSQPAPLLVNLRSLYGIILRHFTVVTSQLAVRRSEVKMVKAAALF